MPGHRTLPDGQVTVRFESLAVALREAEKLAARMNADERVYDRDRLVKTLKPSK